MIKKLFTTFFKIGAFTFGGGYAMISIVKDECVDKNKWLKDDEFLNLIAVAESTPGPISINMATYTGYKVAKMPGAISATIGVILPSIVTIYLITIFVKNILDIKIVASAFMGIRIAVSLIIIRTGFKLLNSELKTSTDKRITYVLFFVYLLATFAINITNINISTVLLILLAIIIGIAFSLVKK